jgi:hypothetical protein
MKPIKVDDFGIIWTAEGVRVAKGERLASDWFTRCIEGPSSDMGKLVIELHSKGGGKHGNHEGITASTTITAISYASVQVYEDFHGAHFHDIPEATALLRTRQFAHISSIAFLCLLTSPPSLLPDGLELSQMDSQRFTRLARGIGKVDDAMVAFRKRPKGKKSDSDVKDNEG